MNSISGGGGAASAGGDGSSNGASQDIKQHFVTREGYYRNLPAYEYSRPNRITNHTPSSLGQNSSSSSQQANLPVKISMVRVTVSQEEAYDDGDQSNPHPTAYPDRILFNVGRELYLYAFKSIWQTPDLLRPLEREVEKVQISCHDICGVNATSEGCTLLIGLVNGTFQVCDSRKERHVYNEDRLLDKGRVTCLKWLPGSQQHFLVGFASGQLLQCDESLPWLATPPSYQMQKHGDGYAIYTCKSRTARNPAFRWLIGEGSLNAIAFSPCAKYLATASHDGYLRLFLLDSMELLGTAKSYFGALLCLAWSPDSNFVCCAGEDDLVHLFSLESRKIVARGRGHRSWVTAVAFDSMTSCLAPHPQPVPPGHPNGAGHSSPPSSAGRDGMAGQRKNYRFASVGQDTQICLWELTDDIVKQAGYSRLRAGSLMPAGAVTVTSSPPLPPLPAIKSSSASSHVRRGMGLMGTRAFSTGGKSTGTALSDPHSPAADKVILGSPLCPKLEEVPLLEPLVCKRIASERLNDIVFHEDCILISTQEGIIMNWSRPGGKGPAPNNSSRHNSNGSN